MRPYLFKNDRAEFPHGYLQWKPEVKEPSPGKYEEIKLFLADQQAIERSRVAVSEELFKQHPVQNSWDESGKVVYYEGKDFTIRDGKAYPVEDESTQREDMQITRVDLLLREFYTKNKGDKGSGYAMRLIKVYAAQQVAKKDAELSRLKAENETMKQALEWIVVNSVFYRDAIKKAEEALETLK